jgi:hypothetical protein
VRRAAPGAIDSPLSIEPHSTARTLAGQIGLVGTHRQSADDARARSPFFCSDFLQDLDVHHPFGQHLLQPSVFRLRLSDNVIA